MLMIFLAAMTAALMPQQKADEPPCRAEIIFVSKQAAPVVGQPGAGGLPRAKTDAEGPALLMPACKPEKSRKKDYPMA